MAERSRNVIIIISESIPNLDKVLFFCNRFIWGGGGGAEWNLAVALPVPLFFT